MKIPYSQALNFLKDGDILLFKGKGFISWMIKTYSYGEYSHVGLLDMSNDIPMCCEMREFKGGRCVSLTSQIDKLGKKIHQIDVFRPASVIKHDIISKKDGEFVTEKVEKRLTKQIRRSIVLCMLKLTGTKYSWRNIFSMIKHYIPIFRLFKAKIQDDEERKLHVCSTAVCFCLRTQYEDPVPFLPDHMVTPSDLSRSPLLKYQFTIEKDS